MVSTAGGDRRLLGSLLIARRRSLAVAASLFVAFSSWLGSLEANAAMAATPAPIDGTRAFGYLEKICEIGPRIAGSEANTRQRKMVADHFKAKGGTVREQPFAAAHPLTGQRVDMVNLIGSWHPERTERVVIAAHYDTRPHPDEERDPARRKLPFLGANDGASGVALLMEIANHLDEMKTPWGVDLVLFDGEELVFGKHPETQGDYFLGSKEFARAYVEDVDAQREQEPVRRRHRPRHGRRGQAPDQPGAQQPEPRPQPGPRRLVRGQAAQRQELQDSASAGRSSTTTSRSTTPGFPTIDIIDFDYAYWHKADDLPKNCSAESLAEVGRVVTAWLNQPPPRRRTRR